MKRLRRNIRLGTCLGVLGVGAIIAFGAANCAAPTQIVVDVRAEEAFCSKLRGTGIVVTTPERIDSDPLEIFEGPGCEKSPKDSVGRLTITPSGDNEATVGVRIVAGVDRPANECSGPKWEGCILARRNVKFVPNKTITVTVILSEACVGKACGKDECDKGACVAPEQIQLDGGISPPKDDGAIDQNNPPIPDAADEVPVLIEAGTDACDNNNCLGGNCSAGRCTIDCTAVQCNNQSICGPGLDCNVKCPDTIFCNNVKCRNTATSCTFECMGGGAGRHCNNINCSALGDCTVMCPDLGGCERIYMDAGRFNEVRCNNNNGVACEDVHCVGAANNSCRRMCGQEAVGCGDASTCSPAGACNMWALADGGPATN